MQQRFTQGSSVLKLCETNSWWFFCFPPPCGARGNQIAETVVCRKCLSHSISCKDSLLHNFMVRANGDHSAISCECGSGSRHAGHFLAMATDNPELHKCSAADKVHFTIDLIEMFLIKALVRTEREQNDDVSLDDRFRKNLESELEVFFSEFPSEVQEKPQVSNLHAESVFKHFVSSCAGEESFEAICSPYGLPYQLCRKVFLEVVGSVAWQKLLGIVTSYSVPFSAETPLIKVASDWLRSLDESSIREVLSSSRWAGIVPCVYEYLGDEPPKDSAVETTISRQRHINRIIQALQMAVVVTDESGPVNPFLDFAVHGFLLSPDLQPRRKIPHIIPESLIFQSCLPNTEVKVEVSKNSKFSADLVALRDISSMERICVSFPDNELCTCFRCLSPRSLRQEFQDLIEDNLPEEVAICLDGLFNLHCSGSSLHRGKRKSSEAFIPEWQEHLRKLTGIFATGMGRIHVQAHFPTLSEWRSYGDYLSSSSSQLDSSTACSQLSCAIAIYSAVLFLTSSSTSDKVFVAKFNSEVALSLATALLEILTTAAQQSSARAKVGLALTLSSSLEELKLVKSVVQLGLQQSRQLSNSTSEALRSILLKQDAFQDLTSLVVPAETIPHRVRFHEFDQGEAIYVAETLSPIFSTSECAMIIADAENFAQMTGSGWSTSRHYSVPTTDLPITSLSHSVRSMVSERFVNQLLPFMRSVFVEPTQEVRRFGGFVFDLFVVKYDGSQRVQPQERQTFLPLHRDQSAHSAVVALNHGGSDFVGGGTYIPALLSSGRDAVICPSKVPFYLGSIQNVT